VTVHVSAKVDYAMRALLELAAVAKTDTRALVKGDALAVAQNIPMKFLESILRDLRHNGIVTSRRGVDGGYRLDRDAADISVADVVRALEGPLAAVRGERPETVVYDGPAEHLQEVWIASRVAIRSVLEHVTLQHVLDGSLPMDVSALLKSPGAWERRN
jgi:Rrf2 family protein